MNLCEISAEDLNHVVYAGMKRLAKRQDLDPALQEALLYAIKDYELDFARDGPAADEKGV